MDTGTNKNGYSGLWLPGKIMKIPDLYNRHDPELAILLLKNLDLPMGSHISPEFNESDCMFRSASLMISMRKCGQYMLIVSKLLLGRSTTPAAAFELSSRKGR